jgi:hypothetical protein
MTQKVDINKLVQLCLPILDFEKKYVKRACGRVAVFTNEFFLKQILCVLISGIPWRNLNLFGIGCTGDYIRKKFNLWVERGYIKNFEKIIIKMYVDYRCKYDPITGYSMDSTTVRNNNGLRKNVGISVKNKGKLSQTLHSLSDNYHITHSRTVTPGNVPDVTQIEPLINNMIVPLNGTYRKPIYIGADKAYIHKDVHNKLKLENIIITCPSKDYNRSAININKKKEIKKIKRKENKDKKNKEKLLVQPIKPIKPIKPKTEKQIEKIKQLKQEKTTEKIKQTKLNKQIRKANKANQPKCKPKCKPKKRLSEKRKEALSKRIEVEHSYNILKRGYKRIDRVYDRKIENYLGFVDLANTVEILKFLFSKDIIINSIY